VGGAGPSSALPKRRLGGNGLEFSAIGLGCMNLSVGYSPPPGEADADRLLRQALDCGINFFDTAEIYGPFSNEQLVGK